MDTVICISCHAKCTVLVCVVPTTFACPDWIVDCICKTTLHLSCNVWGILLEMFVCMRKRLNIFHRFPFLNVVKSFISYYVSTVSDSPVWIHIHDYHYLVTSHTVELLLLVLCCRDASWVSWLSDTRLSLRSHHLRAAPAATARLRSLWASSISP